LVIIMSNRSKRRHPGPAREAPSVRYQTGSPAKGDADMPSEAMQDLIDTFGIGGTPMPARPRRRWKSAAPPSPPGDRLTERVAAKHAGRGRAVVESMNGARFVHDTLEAHGWDVLVADAQRVKGLAPLACKTDKSAWTAAHPRVMKCSA
jgi:hypothetical protein